MNRSEHLQWCKDRALVYANAGDYTQALASMTSDTSKHPDTLGHVGNELGLMLLMGGLIKSNEDMVKHINGYN